MDIQTYINKQLGLCASTSYDGALKRMIVSKGDNMIFDREVSYSANSPPIFTCRFAECTGYEHIIATANEVGRVNIRDTIKPNPTDDLPIDGFLCHSNAIFDLAWMHRDTKLITVSGDHSTRLWDVNDGMRLMTLFCGHERSIKSAAFRYRDDSVFSTGARDGNIFIWDIRSHDNAAVTTIRRPDASIPRCHPILNTTPVSAMKRWIEPGRNSITSLAFQNEMTLLSCGAGDGTIKVWDLRKNYSVLKGAPLSLHSIPYCGNYRNKCGYTNLLIDKSRCKLYASCMDNVIYCFNISSYNMQPDMKYIGHSSATFYIKNSLSPDGKYLVSGSSDENAYIWNVGFREPIVKLTGHSAEVTCATWCNRGQVKIVTCSDDASIKVWRIGKEWLNSEEKIELSGKAENVEVGQASYCALETTPRQQRKRQTSNEVTPSSSAKRMCRRNSNSTEKSTTRKRSLLDILNSHATSGKKAKRELLSAIEESPSDLKENLGVGVLDWKTADVDCPKALSVLYDSTSNLLKTPPKTRDPLSSPDAKPANDARFPIPDFPNYIIDGMAPHRSLMSPRKKRPVTDWLTAFGEEKKIKLSDSSSSSIIIASSSISDTESPRSERGRTRRNSIVDTTPKRLKPTHTLYNYFKLKD